MAKKTYVAQFSFGEVKRGTNRTYAAAWAIFQRPDSEHPTTGFSGSADLARKQISTARGYGATGPFEIVACHEVTK
jgi:hypothetical protein